jgi:hypothetical protein
VVAPGSVGAARAPATTDRLGLQARQQVGYRLTTRRWGLFICASVPRHRLGWWRGGHPDTVVESRMLCRMTRWGALLRRAVQKALLGLVLD